MGSVAALGSFNNYRIFPPFQHGPIGRGTSPTKVYGGWSRLQEICKIKRIGEGSLDER